MGGPAGGGVRTAPGLAGRRGSGAGRSGFSSQLWPASCVTTASSLLNPGPGAPAACVGHSPESHRPHRVRGAARSPRCPCALCRCSSELGRRSEVQRPLGAPASPHSSSRQGTGKEAGSSGRRCPATAERAVVEEGSPLPLGAVAVRSRGSGEHSRMRLCVQGTEPCRVPLGPGWKGTCSPSGGYNSVLSH